ncbi:MAG: winged helix-turn-helix transcriptional regulator [Campylobacteraceae bacterium]|jgi:ArsR family transcriptional regulator|nr:winged helix-turn-helix transcriptional regulator [Campylobacteraceae bacterium]
METFLKVVSALNDESRVKILAFLLEHRCCCVCEIEASLEMAQSTLSRHLKILKDAGFLCASRRGCRSYYDVAARSQMHANMLKEVKALKLKIPIKICAENSTRCQILGK